MSVSRQEIRLAVGRTLRGLRSRRRLSLDDVEQLTRETGVRVTRSHLSRVETGSADIAVPRLLCLLRALGEPADRAARTLDALLDPCDLPPALLLAKARAALARADAPGAVRLLRAALAGENDRSANGLLVAWAAAEAGIGCWPTARRALTDALPGVAGSSLPALRLAVACLGSGRVTLATLLVRAVDAPGPVRTLVEAACRLGRGDADGAASVASEGAAAEPRTDDALALRAATLILLAECYAASGRPRSALRAARRAIDEATGPILAAEAHLAAARASGLSRRFTAGLRLLERARGLARATGLPFLVARVHDGAVRLWRGAGDRGAAAGAARAARSIRRRHGAPGDAAPNVPLLSLLVLLLPPELTLEPTTRSGSGAEEIGR